MPQHAARHSATGATVTTPSTPVPVSPVASSDPLASPLHEIPSLSAVFAEQSVSKATSLSSPLHPLSSPATTDHAMTHALPKPFIASTRPLSDFVDHNIEAQGIPFENIDASGAEQMYPKKPRNAFILFRSHFYEQWRQAGKSVPHQSLMSELASREWASLTTEGKAFWKHKYKEEKLSYDKRKEKAIATRRKVEATAPGQRNRRGHTRNSTSQRAAIQGTSLTKQKHGEYPVSTSAHSLPVTVIGSSAHQRGWADSPFAPSTSAMHAQFPVPMYGLPPYHMLQSNVPPSFTSVGPQGQLICWTPHIIHATSPGLRTVQPNTAPSSYYSTRPVPMSGPVPSKYSMQQPSSLHTTPTLNNSLHLQNVPAPPAAPAGQPDTPFFPVPDISFPSGAEEESPESTEFSSSIETPIPLDPALNLDVPDSAVGRSEEGSVPDELNFSGVSSLPVDSLFNFPEFAESSLGDEDKPDGFGEYPAAGLQFLRDLLEGCEQGFR